MKNNTSFRIALTGILCAQALALNFIESFLPALPFMPPGAKPGLSNIITMFAAYSLGPSLAFTIALIKSSFVFITRGATAFFMSFSGGMLSVLAMWLTIRLFRERIGLLGISVIGSLFHNAGQLLASFVITGNSKTLYYAPALIVFAIVTGCITGVIFRVIIPVLEKQKNVLLHYERGGD